MNLKIAHTADIQINVGESTYHRKREYAQALHNFLNDLVSEKPNILIVAGDQFERFKTTNEERVLWTDFVHKVLEQLPDLHIIVIDGNHDIPRKGFDYFDGYQLESHVYVNEELFNAIKNPRYHYSPKARMLRIPEFPNIIFACWSELAKHVQEYGDVSPWQSLDPELIQNIQKNNLVFDVYHGTISGAQDMGSSHELKPDSVNFYGDIIALGHIHQYQQLGKAFYSSSLVPVKFNEGLRWHNENIIYDYLDKHGYIIYDIEGTSITHRFKSINTSTKYITMIIDQDTVVDMINRFLNPFVHNRVCFKLVLNNPNPESLAYLYDIVSRQNQWNIVKVESSNLNVHKDTEESHYETKKLDLNFETFKPVFKTLLESASCDEFVVNRVLEICEHECGFHLIPEHSKIVEITGFEANNFLTLKHAELDFRKNQLIRISANNGEGKTSILKGILFAATCLTHSSVSKNALKQYHSTLFNDKMVNNLMSRVSLSFTINGSEFMVKHTLNKLLSSDGSLSKIDHVVEILDVQLDEIIHSGEQAVNFLIDTFGGFETFNVMHFLNVENLSYLKTLTGTDFVNFLLSRLGYNAILKLQHFVNGAKHTELQKYPSVSNLSSVQLAADKLASESELNKVSEELQLAIESLENKNSEINKKTEEIDNLYKANPGLLTLANDQLTLTNSYQSIKDKLVPVGITAPELSRDKLVEFITVFLVNWLNKVTDLQKNNKSDVQKYTSDLQNHLKALTEYDNTVSNYDEKIKSLSNMVKANLMGTKDAHDSEIKELNDKLQANSVSMSSLITKRSQHNTNIVQIETQQEQIKKDIETYDAEILSIQNGTCKYCDSNIAHKHTELLITAKDNWLIAQDKWNKSIDSLNDELSEIKQINESIQKLELENTELNDKISLARESSDAVYLKIKKFDEPDYGLLLYNANNPNDLITYPEKPVFNSVEIKETDYEPTLSLIRELSTISNSCLALYDKLENSKDANTLLNQLKVDESKLYTERDTIRDITIDSKRTQQATLNERIRKCSEEILKQQDHEFAKHCCKIYDNLINKWLPGYLYDQAKASINNELAKFDPPNDLTIRLSDFNYGSLVLIDTNEQQDIVERPVSWGGSGMESTIALLHMSTALRRVNPHNRVTLTMIDELSGPLHTGTENDPTDWLEYYKGLLSNMSSDSKLLVIDQRIDNDIFDKVFEVTKDQLTGLSTVH